MSTYVIGVDGGGSKTEAVVLDESRQTLGRGKSGSSNYLVVGLENSRIALVSAMKKSIAEAGVEMHQVSSATWALAGAGRPAGCELLATMSDEVLPGIPVRIEHDALAALVGGVGGRFGVVLNAGTGTIAYGENREGWQARAAGWGHFLDQGNAYGLVQEALRAIANAADGSDLPTQLTGEILGFLELDDPAGLVDWIYAEGRKVADFVALAPLVLATAESGDLLATDVAVRGADALARAVDAVSHRLGLWGQPFPLVLVGGLLACNGFYRQLVAQAILDRIPDVRPRLPRASAAVGAALLALETLGHPLAVGIDVEVAPEGIWSSERRNTLSQDLDLRSTLEMVGLMHLEDGRAVSSVRPNLLAISHAVDDIADRMVQGGRLIYVGAGTSGRLGTLDASECPPTFSAEPGQVVAIIAGGRKALTTAVEAAEDDPEAGREAMAGAGVGKLDSVVGIAASGRTPYVVGALEEARRRGALTTALVCNLPAPVAQFADHVIAPLVGPEVLTGSTRLKAGTAQKLVLNMLSTGVMVRLGKIYGNLMVDVRQQSAKLEQRARRIVAQACDIGEAEASAALLESEGDLKVAIISTLLDCPVAQAREQLAQHGGIVRKALTLPPSLVAQED